MIFISTHLIGHGAKELQGTHQIFLFLHLIKSSCFHFLRRKLKRVNCFPLAFNCNFLLFFEGMWKYLRKQYINHRITSEMDFSQFFVVMIMDQPFCLIKTVLKINLEIFKKRIGKSFQNYHPWPYNFIFESAGSRKTFILLQKSTFINVTFIWTIQGTAPKSGLSMYYESPDLGAVPCIKY